MKTRAPATLRHRARAVATAFWLAGAIIPGVGTATNLGFLKDAPITRFTGPDLEMFQSNLNSTLELAGDGDVRRWKNSDTGSAGEIKLVKSFAHDNQRCRGVRIRNQASGYSEAVTDAVFCKDSTGQWKSLPASKWPADLGK